MGLATGAGRGSALAYAIPGSIVAGALAHPGLTRRHRLFSGYPALARAGGA